MGMFYIGIACCSMFLDLLLKHWIELGKGETEKAKVLQKKLFCNKILIDRCYNFGAVLNLGDKRPKTIRRVSEVIFGGILILFAIAFQKKESKIYCMGMALLLGGSGSNVYDRMEKGYVIDYFRFNIGWKKLKQIVFNLADLFIISGAILVFIAKMKE